MSPKGEIFDNSRVANLPEHFTEITFDAMRILISVLGTFFHQLQDDFAEHFRNVVIHPARRRRAFGDVAMDQFQRIAACERSLPREQLIKRNAQRIEIRAKVNGPVHATGLFRRHVSQIAIQVLRCVGPNEIGIQNTGDAEVDNLHLMRLSIPDNIGTTDVLMRDQCRVNIPQSTADGDGNLQSFDQRWRFPLQPHAEALSPDVLDAQRDDTVLFDHSEDFGHIRRVNTISDRKLLMKLDDFPGGWRIRFEYFQDRRRCVACWGRLENQRVLAFIKLLCNVKAIDMDPFRHCELPGDSLCLSGCQGEAAHTSQSCVTPRPCNSIAIQMLSSTGFNDCTGHGGNATNTDFELRFQPIQRVLGSL